VKHRWHIETTNWALSWCKGNREAPHAACRQAVFGGADFVQRRRAPGPAEGVAQRARSRF
jgi:hypothetical protein